MTSELHQDPGTQARVQWPPRAELVGVSRMRALPTPVGTPAWRAASGGVQSALPTALELRQQENDRQGWRSWCRDFESGPWEKRTGLSIAG